MAKTKIPKNNFLALVLILGLALTAGLLLVDRQYDTKQIGQESGPPDNFGRKSLPSPKSISDSTADAPEPATKDQKPAGAEPLNIEDQASDRQDACDRTIARISKFFDDLDKQDYITQYQLQGGSQNHFNQLLGKLFANPPIVARETDDLIAILKNMAHFYKILGGRNIMLIKDVLTHEAESVETVMALFNTWSELKSCTGQKSMNKMAVEEMYEYAGFFINTMGGQAYLLRRPSLIRLLVRYYSILILDRANSEGKNHYGIDIRFPINSLIEEMEVFRQPTYREDYLEELYRLQKKYRLEYGGG